MSSHGRMSLLGRGGSRTKAGRRRSGLFSTTHLVSEEPAPCFMDAGARVQIEQVHDLRDNRKRRTEVEVARLSRLVQVASENAERARMGWEEARASRQSTEAALVERCTGRRLTLQQTSALRERVQAELRRVEQARADYEQAAAEVEVHRQTLAQTHTDYQGLLKKIEKTEHMKAWMAEETTP